MDPVPDMRSQDPATYLLCLFRPLCGHQSGAGLLGSVKWFLVRCILFGTTPRMGRKQSILVTQAGGQVHCSWDLTSSASGAAEVSVLFLAVESQDSNPPAQGHFMEMEAFLAGRGQGTRAPALPKPLLAPCLKWFHWPKKVTWLSPDCNG